MVTAGAESKAGWLRGKSLDFKKSVTKLSPHTASSKNTGRKNAVSHFTNATVKSDKRL